MLSSHFIVTHFLVTSVTRPLTQSNANYSWPFSIIPLKLLELASALLLTLFLDLATHPQLRCGGRYKMQLHLAFVQFKLTVSCLPKKVQQCLIMLYTCLPYSVSFPEDQNVICYYGDIRLLGTPQELMMNQKAFFTTHIYHLLSGNYLDQKA